MCYREMEKHEVSLTAGPCLTTHLSCVARTHNGDHQQEHNGNCRQNTVHPYVGRVLGTVVRTEKHMLSEEA